MPKTTPEKKRPGDQRRVGCDGLVALGIVEDLAERVVNALPGQLAEELGQAALLIAEGQA